MVTGTSKSHQRVKPKDVLGLEIVTPTQFLAHHFDQICAHLIDRIFLSKKENQILSNLRDTLLPKLISGKLQIPDAEKFLKEAGI